MYRYMKLVGLGARCRSIRSLLRDYSSIGTRFFVDPMYNMRYVFLLLMASEDGALTINS